MLQAMHRFLVFDGSIEASFIMISLISVALMTPSYGQFDMKAFFKR